MHIFATDIYVIRLNFKTMETRNDLPSGKFAVIHRRRVMHLLKLHKKR